MTIFVMFLIQNFGNPFDPYEQGITSGVSLKPLHDTKERLEEKLKEL